MRNVSEPFEPAIPGTQPERRYHVLVVDDEPAVRQLLGEMLDGQRIEVHAASTLAEARIIADRGGIDVALIDVTLPDGDGTDLADELHRRDPSVQSIIITARPDCHAAVGAMRAGACDFLGKPFKLEELNRCVGRALKRREDGARTAERLRQLRAMAHKLAAAPRPSLAGQLQEQIEDELNLEQVLRRVLESILHEAGATNALVMLPSSAGALTIGGYINYSLDKGRVESLLNDLTDTIGPIVADGPDCVHFTDPAAIARWTGGGCDWLWDHHIVALPCRDRGELLAAIVLFRDGAQPYDPGTVEALSGVCPMVARHLVKVVNIHHRLRDDDTAFGGGEHTDPDEMTF